MRIGIIVGFRNLNIVIYLGVRFWNRKRRRKGRRGRRWDVFFLMV